MTFGTLKFAELPLITASLSFPFSSCSKPSFSFSLSFFKSFSSRRFSTRHHSHKSTGINPNPSPSPRFSSHSVSTSSSSASWIQNWPPHDLPDNLPSASNAREAVRNVENKAEDEAPPTWGFNRDRGSSAIERIVLRLRNLGLGSDDEDGVDDVGNLNETPVTGDEKLGQLLERNWVRPDRVLIQTEEEENDMFLPWDRPENWMDAGEKAKGRKKQTVKAPSLAEMTIEDKELRRLRRAGIILKEKITVPKAGITQDVLDKIHDKWRKAELVRLKFHEDLVHDMKTGQELVERRSGGLVIWRSGSVMVVFRGSNYEGPYSRKHATAQKGDAVFIPNASSVDNLMTRGASDGSSTLESSVNVVQPLVPVKTEEEAEYNRLLDGLGPRFVDWWGTGVLPVDADLLAETVPGYKPPFRLLPTGKRSSLTSAELASLRKLSKTLPCHFALGRNRNHQGLAAAIIMLWEKSLVAKIAVKPGIMNTNNKLMAKELKELTGGQLLVRNKYYIIMYRGKDFLPTSVAAALAERHELAKQIQDAEEKVRTGTADVPSVEGRGQALAGTLGEFYEAQARWGKEVSATEREKMIEEASGAKNLRVVQRMEHKFALSQAKKFRAEQLLAKIEASMVPVDPSNDQETLSNEEKFMFRRIGLKMKAYLPLGIRGVFDGVIENMHLHWKYRELVKLISKQKTLAFVEETARLLEHESGGILVAIEPIPKGYAIIYYRGKNYQRPISLRPRNLLTKAKALKRSVARQRHEALRQHISELGSRIEQMKRELGNSADVEDNDIGVAENHKKFDHISQV